MKEQLKLRIAATNIMCCLRILIIASLLGSIVALLKEGMSNGAFFAPFVFLIYFGWLFWIGFIVATFVADMILFAFDSATHILIIIESVSIGGVFMFWGVYYEYYVWFALVAIYCVCQWRRVNEINQIIAKNS